MQAALAEAVNGMREWGIPIGSVLVVDGRILSRGHNQRFQKGSVLRHAEMDCLENAGRQKPGAYKKAVLYTTLSPCDMCSGAILLYGIPKVVVGENTNFKGPEEYLKSRGVEVTVLNDPECIKLMREYIQKNPEMWGEDISR